MFVFLLATILIVSNAPRAFPELEQSGPKIDVVRFKVSSPGAQLSEMLDPSPEFDAVAHLRRPYYIERLDEAGMTITAAPGFHIGHIAFNIRPDQSYRQRSDHALVAAVLSDVWFRLALFKCFDQNAAILSTYGYIATPIQSPVPPAQAGWYNPNVPKVSYNPGDSSATTKWPEDDSACGVLRYAGYTYDAAINNWRTPEAWGPETGGKLIPPLTWWWPSVACSTPMPAYLQSWENDCHDIGLVSVDGEPADWGSMMHLVFEKADFDMFLCFWGLGRFPNHLYDMYHSSQDSALHPWKYNTPGIHDDYLDELVETVKFSLNHTAKLEACHEAQRVLYDYNYPDCAFAYMQLYSWTYFNAHMEGLEGIVNSPGYGSHNQWTLLNMRWKPNHPNERIEDGKRAVIWALDEEPLSLNPCFASTQYGSIVIDPHASRIIEPTLDGLIMMNPYTHEDEPWIATGWSVEGPINETVTLDSENRYLGVPAGGAVDVINGMKITFNLRTDVHWQCGNPYQPSDAEFSLEFLRDNQIPRYASALEHIVDVQAVNATAFTVYSDAASQWLLYDFAETAALLPPPVWSWLDGQPLDTILSYDPSINRTKPLGAGAMFGERDPETGQPLGAVAQLYGTGPFIFDYYDPANMVAELHANRNYFKTTAEIQDQLVELFHRFGDVNRDGWISATDMNAYGLAYGCEAGEPCYNADADLNEDGIVDALDGSLIGASMGKRREYGDP